MIDDLRAVHDSLRRDIAVLDRALTLLDDSTADPSAVPTMISGLTIAQFEWQLRVNCETYCNILTGHHSLEDHRMFPVMLRRFPELAPAIERLYKEHEAVVGLITATSSAARDLGTGHPAVTRARRTIETLRDHLLAHLAFEEETLFPYFATMTTDWHLG
ncbi:hemerythrin domain-containing protein [Nocardia sp. NPDC127526]|uniref:hemerythrin domain-containing protein n=1 Tax=Nocardia sp. NPDC127526 TaxID=3345393 RepID=UPI003639ABB4